MEEDVPENWIHCCNCCVIRFNAKRLKMLNHWSKFFLIMVFFETLVVLVFEITSLMDARDDATRYYASITLILMIFFDYFAIDGIFTENVNELVAFIIAHSLLAISHIYQVTTHQTDEQPILDFTLLTLFIIFQILYIIIAAMLNKEFGWWAFRKLRSGDVKLNALYKKYQLFLTLLKCDFMSGIVQIVQTIILLHQVELLYILIPLEVLSAAITLFWAILGYRAMRNESRTATSNFFVLSILSPAMVIYKAYKLISLEAIVDAQVYTFAALAILVRCFLLLVAYYLYRNFGKGLKEHAFLKTAIPEDGLNKKFLETASELEEDFKINDEEEIVVENPS